MSSSWLQSLPPSTVGRLASGQVVQSVSNVVKELVENALDAGASAIEVHLDNFGADTITVKDNGSGLARTEIPVMVQEHTTSKISAFEDLESLRTYGFRGEALSAIARLKIASKREVDQVGCIIKFASDGNAIEESSEAMTKGTVVTVSDLFYNLPVRRKLIQGEQKKRDELKRTEFLLQVYSIARPEARLSLKNDGANVFTKQACNTQRASIHQVMKASIGNKLDLVTMDSGESMHLELYLPHPPQPSANSLGRANADKTFLIINGRPIEHKPIFRVFSKASRSVNERFPVSVVIANVSGDCIDVNLDPSKIHVFLKDQDKLLNDLEAKLLTFYELSEEGESNEPPTGSNDSINRSIFDKTPHDISCTGDNNSDMASASLGEPVSKPQATSTQLNEDKGESPDFEVGPIQAPTSPLAERLDQWSTGRLFNKPVNTIFGHSSAVKRKTDGTLQLTPPPAAASKPRYAPRRRAEAAAETSFPKLDAFLERTQRQRVVGNLSQSVSSPETARSTSVSDKENNISSAPHNQATRLSSEDMTRMKQKLSKTEKSTNAQNAQKSTAQVLQSLSRLESVKMKRKRFPLSFSLSKCGVSSPSQVKEPRYSEILGKLENSPFWIGRFKEDLLMFNHHRFEEVQLCKRLMRTYELNTKQLPEALMLNDLPNWSQSYSNALESIQTNEQGIISDPRVIMNGFYIRRDSSASLGPASYSLLAVPSQFPFDCPGDVLAFLSTLSSSQGLSVSECRSGKAIVFLKGEALRLVRQSPPGIDEDAVKKLWRSYHQSNDTCCLHGQPIVTKIVYEPLSNFMLNFHNDDNESA